MSSVYIHMMLLQCPGGHTLFQDPRDERVVCRFRLRRRELCGFRLSWRELGSSKLRRKELGYSRLGWRELVGSRRDRAWRLRAGHNFIWADAIPESIRMMELGVSREWDREGGTGSSAAPESDGGTSVV